MCGISEDEVSWGLRQLSRGHAKALEIMKLLRPEEKPRTEATLEGLLCMIRNITESNQRQEREDLAEAQRLVRALCAHFYPDNPGFAPFDNMEDVLSQIDNMVTGITRDYGPYSAKQCDHSGCDCKSETRGETKLNSTLMPAALKIDVSKYFTQDGVEAPWQDTINDLRKENESLRASIVKLVQEKYA